MKDNEGYDGSKLRYHEMWLLLELEYERQMWEHWKRTYSNGFPWDKVLKIGEGIVGKAMITSTVDIQDSGADFRELWNDSMPEKESALYRVFKPAWDANIDEYGFKKDEDEK